jgi:hypothetical protein
VLPEPAFERRAGEAAGHPKLAEIIEALPHLPPPAIEIILQTVRAFRE